MDPSQSGSAATANGQKTTAAGGLTEPQRQALTAFLAVADSISRALAADDLKAFNHQTARLASVLPPLQKELATPHPWGGLIEHLAASSEKEPAKDLKAARGRFLAFSTAAVELAKTLRKTDPAFAGLKIYHCPMAPEPGLWIQANSPLANPFFGEKMLTCGDEVLE
jgi:Cu(I)/Ag(I) efflux system membrane fusion protein